MAGLGEALLQAGVASRHVQRAVLEINEHFEDLVAQARSRGSDEASSRQAAWEILGPQREIVRSYASRSELRAWSRRRPLVFFMVLPLLAYATAGGACIFILAATAQSHALFLKRLQFSAGVTQGIDLAASIGFLWLLPWIIGGAFATLAQRRRAPLLWPSLAICCVSALASLCNVEVTIGNGAHGGAIGAGIGISLQSLPQRLLHTALLVLPALFVSRLAAVRSLRNSALPSND